MTIFASCGHEVAGVDELVAVEYDDEEIDFDIGGFVPVTVTGVYCPKCAQEGAKSGHLRISSMAECRSCKHWKPASYGKHGYCCHIRNAGVAPATGQLLRRGTRPDDCCCLYEAAKASQADADQ